jgi:hypothetical protein
MHSRHALSLILVIVATVAVPAMAVDRYVSVEGTDQGACTTQDDPCRTVGYAVAQSSDADRIVVSAGTYLECVDASTTLLDFEGDTTDGEVVLNGAPVCGGTVCESNDRLNCYSDSTCSGDCLLSAGTDGFCSNDRSVACAEETCEVPDGETAGTCELSGVDCESDQDCADAQCEFGTCTDLLACSDDGSRCAIDDDCTAGTCEPVPGGPVLRLSSGSSLEGFTVRNGGDSGVVADGSVTIRSSRITHNYGADAGGGVHVDPFPASAGAGLAERCYERPTLACDSASTNPCSTCSDRSELLCVDDPGCAGACTFADGETEGTCSNDSSATCQEETCVIEDGAGTGVCTTSLVECTDDQDCADAQCDFGPCEIGTLAPCVSSYLALLEDNRIHGNISESYGGGVYADLTADASSDAGFVVLMDNRLDNNTSTGSGSGDGGGIWARLGGSGDKVLRIVDNEIADNLATSGNGGVAVSTDGASGDTEATLEDNAIAGNDSHGTAGAALAVISASAAGTERITVTGNVVENNDGPAGGMVATVTDPAAGSSVDLEIGLNSITHNESTIGGGGLRLEVNTDTAGVSRLLVSVADNTVSGNTTGSDGGGLLMSVDGTALPVDTTYEITGNTIFGNAAEGSGAGVLLTLHGNVAGAEVGVDFDHNLVANNVAGSVDTVGGGVQAELTATAGDVRLNTDFNTFVENVSSFGGAGINVETDVATGRTANVDITNSIFQANQGAGFGGTAGGDGTTTIYANDDLFWLNGSPWERTLEPVLDLPDPSTERLNLLFEDPLMSDLYVLETCSPAVDGADPAVDPGAEPEPNGDRANMGYLGGTVRATTSLADVNGDDRVDGKDVLILSTAFNAPVSDVVRYIAEADLDTSGLVDGDDLAYIGAAFGDSCDTSEE